MVVKYDSLNRMEPPKFTLCNPGSVYKDGLLSNVVGMLTDTEAEEIVFNFDVTSELNFRINKIRRKDPDENTYTHMLYKAIQNRRLIFVEDIGYFVITSINDGSSDGLCYKDVRASSVDIELQQKMTPYIADGTYRFTTDDTGTNKGILETIIETIPLWTIGYVDDVVAKKWRTFEDVGESLNCLAFLLDNIQEAYECIVLFDIVNRTINVYDQSNYIKKTDIHITKDDLINSLDITEDAEDVYTAISVFGDNDVTISAINPLGGNTLYNFDYYIGWMSEGLREKVSNWQRAVSEEKEHYYNLNLLYHKKLSEAYNTQADIDKFSMQIKMYERCRENIVAESNTSLVGNYNTVIVEYGGKAIEVYDEIGDTLNAIDSLIATCKGAQDNAAVTLADINEEVTSYQASIADVHDQLAITSYFTNEEQAELSHYIYEGNYTDEYIVVTDVMSYEEKFNQMKILYDRAEAQLKKASVPTQEFSVDVENFIFVKDFAHWSEQLETGCLINVELDTDDIASLFLSNITINYDDHNLTMTFGNRLNKFDPKSLFEDVLGKINKSANTLNFVKDVLHPIKNGEFNDMKESLQASRNLTMGATLSSEGERVVIDGSGYTGKELLNNGMYDPRQVKLTGKSLVFTDDAWRSSKVAIGELLFGNGQTAYGINAETIIGDIIMGNNLHIYDNKGNELFSAIDGKISSSVEELDEKVGVAITSITQTSNDLSIKVQELENKEVNSVTTTTGYKFDADGLNIHKSGDEITNLLNNKGMYVSRNNSPGATVDEAGKQEVRENILVADADGVNAINLTARQYLIIGTNSRFESYSDGSDTKRTACFYIGA